MVTSQFTQWHGNISLSNPSEAFMRPVKIGATPAVWAGSTSSGSVAPSAALAAQF